MIRVVFKPVEMKYRNEIHVLIRNWKIAFVLTVKICIAFGRFVYFSSGLREAQSSSKQRYSKRKYNFRVKRNIECIKSCILVFFFKFSIPFVLL